MSSDFRNVSGNWKIFPSRSRIFLSKIGPQSASGCGNQVDQVTGKSGNTVRTSGERCGMSGSGDFKELPGFQQNAEVVHSHFNLK